MWNVTMKNHAAAYLVGESSNIKRCGRDKLVRFGPRSLVELSMLELRLVELIAVDMSEWGEP